MSRIIPLDDLDGRIPRIGKISAGYTDARTTNGKTVTFPVKSRTLVFRGSDREPLDAAAAIVGGDVSASPNPRAEGLWRLVSQATAIDVVIADELRDRPGRYEFWGKHGKLRDCDGRSCRFLIDPQSGERREDVPCFCAALGLTAEDQDACRITTRLNVIVPAFAESPGMGVWQLESRADTCGPAGESLRGSSAAEVWSRRLSTLLLITVLLLLFGGGDDYLTGIPDGGHGGSEDSRDCPAHRARVVPGRRVALILLGSI